MKTDKGIAIDIRTITNITRGGNYMSPSEILTILKTSNILIYDGSKGNKPFKFDPKSEIKLIDASSDDAKKAIADYYSSKNIF